MKQLVVVALAVLCGSLYLACSSESEEEQGSDCISRCEAIAANCGLDASKCPDQCPTMTEKQLSCMETTNCNSEAYNACVQGGGGGEDVVETREDTTEQPGEDTTVEEQAGSNCTEDCEDNFEYCDETLGECVNCLDDGHCSTAYDGPVCIFKGTEDAVCGCDTSGECTGHPSGPTCHGQHACSCADDFECSESAQGTACVVVFADIGLSQCGCNDASVDCPAGMACLANKCM